MAELVTTGRIADITGKTQRTILNWLNQGLIPGAVKMGGSWLIDEQKFRQFFNKTESKKCRSTFGANIGGLKSLSTVRSSDDLLKQRLKLKH